MKYFIYLRILKIKKQKMQAYPPKKIILCQKKNVYNKKLDKYGCSIDF